MKRLKVIFLSQRFLFPADSGGKIRTSQLLYCLQKHFDVTVIGNYEQTLDAPFRHRMDEICQRYVPVPWTETKRKTPMFFLKLLWQSLLSTPISVQNDYSVALEDALRLEIDTGAYDLAICDFLQSSLNFKNIDSLPTVLFQHNVETTIAERHLVESKHWFSRLFWFLQARRMRRYEHRVCAQQFDAIISVSRDDSKRMQTWFRARRVYDIPTGVDLEYFKPVGAAEDKAHLVFVGGMDWLPNEDAMIFFINSILPKISLRCPDVQLTIVGRRPSKKLSHVVARHANIHLTGWVEDTRPYIAQSSVYIVPLRIGGGTRMKIYQALSMGKAMVSTTIGAEGLYLKHAEHLLLADPASEFADCVVRLLQNVDERQRLGNTAREYVNKHCSWETVSEKFSDICQQTVRWYQQAQDKT